MADFKIECERSSWPGWGSDCPPGHRIRVHCNNRLLEEADNLSQVQEYLLLETWKKKSRRTGFAGILDRKPLAFHLCDLCHSPLRDGGGSVWDISYCKACDKAGKVAAYSRKKSQEQEQANREFERMAAQADEDRRQKVKARLDHLRLGELIAANDRGEFRSNDKTIAFVPHSTEWDHEIIEAQLNPDVMVI